MGAAKVRGSSLLRNDVEVATLKLCVIADVWARAERESCDGLGDSRKRVRDCGERVRCYGAFYKCGRLRVRWFDVRRCYDRYDRRCDNGDSRRCDNRWSDEGNGDIRDDRLDDGGDDSGDRRRDDRAGDSDDRWDDRRRCYDGYDGRCDDGDGDDSGDRRRYYDGRCDDSGDGVREDDWCEVG